MIDGFAIGHCTADGDGWLTGTTVVSALSGAVGGVDVRGGAPGTRETDLLDPLALVDRVDAVVLTGGSAYGLAAADGVMTALAADRRGFRVGPSPDEVVPIVPAAVLFDLGRGGRFASRPTADFGARAYAAAVPTDPAAGCVGAGTGATCGGLKGGFGYAEQQLPSGVSVAAAVALNAAGSPVDARTGRLHADRGFTLPDPSASERSAMAGIGATPPRLNTTIGVILTDATLTKAQAAKVAAVAHDGLARAVRPAHSMLDGDTIFCLASLRRPAPDLAAGPGELNALLVAAADVFTDACFDALVSASARALWPCYRDLAPSAALR